MLLAHGPMLICPAELAMVLAAIPGITYLIHRIRTFITG